MRTKRYNLRPMRALTVTVVSLASFYARPIFGGTSYPLSYGGRLTQADGAPLTGSADIQIKFWNTVTDGEQIGSTLEFIGVQLNQGVFAVTMELDGGAWAAIFGRDDKPVFIEISAGGKTYPRQRYSFVPFALRIPVDEKSLTFDSATGKLGIAVNGNAGVGKFLTTASNGQLSWGEPTVSKIQGYLVENDVPTTGQVLSYNGHAWVPTTPVIGSGVGTLAVSSGGTGAVSLEKNSVIIGAGDAPLASVSGSAHQVLTAGAGGTPGFGPVNLSSNAAVTGILPRSVGGTGVSSAAIFPVAGVVVTEDATEVLTGKTLTTALLNGSSTIGGDTIVETTGTIRAGNTSVTSTLTIHSDVASSAKMVFNDKTSNKFLAFTAPSPLTQSTTWILPATDGAPGQALVTNGAGAMSWTSSIEPTGNASGDLIGSYPGPSVASVGSSSAYKIHSAELLANAATDVNTPATIIRRDAAGSFAAGTITANLIGNATNATSATSFTGSLAGDVTGTQGATSVVTVGGVSAANVASGADRANGATSTNTASSLVARDAFGNFDANTITANLTGTASNAISAVSFTGLLAGDVRGTQGATTVAVVGGVTEVNVASGANLANAATANNSTLAIVKRDLNGGFNSGLIISAAPNSATQGHIVIGSANQTANLQEWQDSSSNLLSAISPSGALVFKDSDGSANYINIQASPAMATDLTLTLPGSVTAGGYLTTDSSGTLSWSTPGGFTGSLAGDVTGTQSATSVATVGGVSAANVAAGANLANGATSANTAAKLVARDTSGNFAAGTVTANLNGTATNATSAVSFTGALAGDVTGTQGATSVVTVGGMSAANVAAGANLANGATSTNTALKLVARDASGNFAAGTITADLNGTATSATSAGSFTGALAGDVTGLQGTTSVASVGGVSAANVATGANLANGATSANTASKLVARDASGNFAAGAITAVSMRVSTNLGVGTSTAHTAIQVAGPVATAVTTKTAAYTISDTDSIVIADATTAAYALTLPSAVGIAGRQYLIKKRDNSANAVTVATTSSQTIDGASSFVLGSQWVFVTVISDGANWIIAATNAVGVPSGSVAYFNAAACPSGWSELISGRGRVLVGMQAGGTLAGTVGTELSNLATRDITSVPAHSHTISAPVTTTSNGGAHTHSVDPPSTATSNTDGSHVHSIDPPSTSTSSGGAHSHAILAGPGDDLNFSGNYDGVTDSDSYAAVWRNTNVAGTHSHTVDIVAFSSAAAGAHGHTVDIAAFNSTSGGAHDHTVTIPSFTSASTGSASVDVTMPYLQLLVCQKI